MALHTLGTTSTTALLCLAAFSQAISDADMASMAEGILSDNLVKNAGIVVTGTTHGNTSITGLSINTSKLAVGMSVIGPSMPVNTFIETIASSSAITINSTALTNTTAQNLIFLPKNRLQAVRFTRQGILEIPGGRGWLQVLPGDYVARDALTGWPILVSGEAVAATGSVWNFV